MKNSLPITLPHVLIVESDEVTTSLLRHACTEQLNLGTLHAASPRDAMRIIRVLKPTLLVLNCHFLDSDGEALYHHLHVNPIYTDMPILLLCKENERCHWHGKLANLFILKVPYSADEMIASIQTIQVSRIA